MENLEAVAKTLKETFKHGHPDFVDITLTELKLHDEKNYDYASGGTPLGNFERVATILSLYPGLPIWKPVVVALIYMLKQLDAILWGLSQNIKHKVEGLDGRFADSHVYIKIARCAWRDEQRMKGKKNEN